MNPNMSPIDWAKRPLQKYADFTGRAPRAEFWWYCLFIVIAAIITLILDSLLGFGRVFLVYGPLTLALLLATFVPSLAVQVRRLHDRNQPGWWLLGFYGVYALMLILNPAMIRGEAATAPSLGSALIGGVLGLIVLAIAITLLVFYCLPGAPGENRYGPNPYGAGGGGTVPAE